MRNTVSLVLMLAALAFGTWSEPAYAYLDPGTGSMILQILVGGIAGVALAGRFYWHRLLVMIGARTEPSAEANGDEISPRADR